MDEHLMSLSLSPTQADSWREIVSTLALDREPDRLWGSGPRGGTWLDGARGNVSVACVDRHAHEHPDRIAVHWEGEPGDRRSISYQDLLTQVTALARALRAMGVGVGDRVGLHLGWVPEAVVAMLACARIGAAHTVLPAPLPVDALIDRLEHLDLQVLFTQDGAWRHGAVLPLKARADEALLAVGSIRHTVVVRRTGMDVAWYEGDRWYHDLVAAARPGTQSTEHADQDSGEPVSVPADHPIALVPLANRAGHHLSVVHGAATMLLSASAVHRQISAGPVFWCAGDIAWAVTQFHGIYGPLAAGASTVMYEGTLDVPTHQRAWEIIARYGVRTLLTTPSVMRTVRGWARTMPTPAALPTLRRIVTAGEPIEPELATWMAGAMADGHGQDPRPGPPVEVGDAWGQLELGGIVRVSGLPGPQRLPDCGLLVVDDAGRPLPAGSTGEVVLTAPWPGSMVALAGHRSTPLVEAHWARHPGAYSTGDLAVQDDDGSLTFLGRSDEVVSISGQLVSLREVQQVLLDHPHVQDAEVTWRKDADLGRSLVAVVVLAEPGRDDGREPDLDAVGVELMETVRDLLGGLARPRAVLVLDRLGDDLEAGERSLAYAMLATAERRGGPRRVTWAQVRAAAGR